MMAVSTAANQAPGRPSPTLVASALAFLRRRPLVGYFILAFAFAWAWEVPIFAIAHQGVFGPWAILVPTAAGFVMAWVTEGRAGMGRLLRRCLLWRAGIAWYLVALLCLPAVYLLGISLMPGSIAALRIPGPTSLLTYLSTVALMFISAPLGEEAGWRGFALPRLQAHHGPLRGTLLLGALWVFWHLPYWLFIPGGNAGGAPNGPVEISISFAGWGVAIVASAVIYTWVVNHTRGSVLLAMLLHASVNASYLTVPGMLFPTLFPPESVGQYPIPPTVELSLVVVGVLIVVATRARLGYDRYLRDTAEETTAPAAAAL